MADYTTERRGPAIKLRWGAALYLVLFCYALLMTQLLRNPISAVFFWFMLIAAPLSFLVMLIGRAAIQVYVMTDKNQTEKLSPVEYEIRVINGSPIPYPFVEAIMSKPREDGVRCLHQRLVLSLIPFGGYSVKNTVSFRYRGLYEIGVHELYICDPLRIFRMRVDIDNFSNVTVYPRKLSFEKEGESAVSDVPSPFVRVLDSRDKSEVSNIREYRMGDTLKSIHWKLSSKSEELQVKDYNTNNDRHTYIFVDLAAPSPCPEEKRQEALRTIKRLSKKQGSEGEEKKSLKERILESIERAKQKRKEKRYRRRRKRGTTAKDLETIDMIDALIRDTSKKPPKEDKKQKKQPPAGTNASEASADEVLAQLNEIVGDNKTAVTEDELTRAKRAWGGIVKDEFEDELPEYCADGVVEIAVASMNSEIRRGNYCTVVWYDSRSESGMFASRVNESSEFENTYLKFASAPVASEDKRITELCNVIGEAVNVTIKIITANIDPESVAHYANVPSMFGGAGTGCLCEVLLFNPTDKYVSHKERLEYTDNVRFQLKHNGISLSDIKEINNADGSTVLVTTELF